MEILKELSDWQRQRFNSGEISSFRDAIFSPASAFGSLYSYNALSLDDNESHLEEFRFVLDSLVETGELGFQDYSYNIQAKALGTLSRFENDTQRYTVQRNHDRRIAWFTGVIAVAAVLQLLSALFHC